MELLAGLPVVGQLSILGLLVALVLFFVIQHVRGESVPRKQVDQVQKTADTFQHAWETSMQSQKELVEVVTKLTAVADTFEHLIESLPKPDEAEH